MMFIKLLFGVTTIILLIRGLFRYNPKLDLVESGRKYVLLFWYNKYDWTGDCKRTYIKLFSL
jgi:hypothetical protein